MPDDVLRRALPADLIPIMSLERMVSQNPWSEQSLTPYLQSTPADSHRALVVQRSGDIAGFAIFSHVLDEGSIDNIVIHTALQGRGLGQQLLQGVLRQMTEDRLVRCLLEVRESNVAARALYDNNGFVVDGVRPRYYKTGQGREDALLMSRRL